jgi:hypothetical protein
MHAEHEPEKIAEEIGIEAVDRVVHLAEKYCQCECDRLALTNQPAIELLRAELTIRAQEVAALEARRERAEPLGSQSDRKRQAWYFAGVALILTVAAFFFSLITFEPYQMAWKGYLYCMGIAVVTPFCLERFLETWDCRGPLKIVVSVAFFGAFVSLALLATIRGSVIAQQMQTEAPAVELDRDADVPAPVQPGNSFYKDTVALLRLAMVLLAVAMELAAGLALFNARKIAARSGESYEALSAEIVRQKREMATLLGELTARSNEAPVFASRFWRNFYRTMLTHTMRNALTKVFLLILIFPFISRGQTASSQGMDLVIAVDLSASVAAQDHSGETEFQKNIEGVAHLLAVVPAGSKVTVLGITESSFSLPSVLLSGKIIDDRGYFGEKLSAARKRLVRAWRERARNLKPQSTSTDILGAMVVAHQLFEETPKAKRKILVLFSDMRQSALGFDLEHFPVSPSTSFLARVERANLLADLTNVDVYALGVDAAGENVRQWENLHQFWIQYFAKAKGELKEYTQFRSLPSALTDAN